MTNCKTCTHYFVCAKKIDDFKTYRVCKDYQGTCQNCLHRDTLLGVDRCHETCHRCDEIWNCGLWEMRPQPTIDENTPDDYADYEDDYIFAEDFIDWVEKVVISTGKRVKIIREKIAIAKLEYERAKNERSE